ncbi:unnamed protein product [Streptomyces laurentii]|uniref:Uncharacterized protein n=1 Tax=Streptomyces laurentii TaxID=39478 RepID=A0A160P6L8_STRLU|nr:unnamed protein product [Streptomyces laurentii]
MRSRAAVSAASARCFGSRGRAWSREEAPEEALVEATEESRTPWPFS